MVEPDRPQMTIYKGYRHTLRICYTYCSSTAKVVKRMLINVTLSVHCHCRDRLLSMLRYPYIAIAGTVSYLMATGYCLPVGQVAEF